MRKFKTYSETAQFVRKHEVSFRKLHHDEDLTAREVADKLGIEFNKYLPKALLINIGRKGYPHGGPAKNAGNKKGIRFCAFCRKSQKNCKCEL